MTATFLPPDPEHISSQIMIPDMKTTVSLFGVHLRHVEGDWTYPVHTHPQYEINYVVKGRQLMNVGGRHYIQQAGDFFLLRPGLSHSSRSVCSKPFAYFCMHFDIDDQLLLSLLSRMEQTLFSKDSRTARQVEPMLSKLIRITETTGEHSTVACRMRLQAAIFELFGGLWEALSNEAALLSAPAYEKVELANQIRSRLQALVSQQFMQGAAAERHYGVDDIAGQLGISVSYCNRVFRQVYGIPPRVYLSGLVLHEAKLLLSDQRLAVQHIAALLGYRDIAHFSRQFKRWTGVSPSEYRRDSRTDAIPLPYPPTYETKPLDNKNGTEVKMRSGSDL